MVEGDRESVGKVGGIVTASVNASHLWPLSDGEICGCCLVVHVCLHLAPDLWFSAFSSNDSRLVGHSDYDLVEPLYAGANLAH